MPKVGQSKWLIQGLVTKEAGNLLWMGVDPGWSGGIAVVSTQGVVAVSPASTEHQAWDFIQSFVGKDIRAVIERVHAMPGQGVSSMFKFGMSYGMLRGMLIASRITFTEALPQRWMKMYGISKVKGEKSTVWKNRLRQLSLQLYPYSHLLKHLTGKQSKAVSDAVLIAHYAQAGNY